MSYDYQLAQVIMKLIANGESCNTCESERYGMCPYDDGRYPKPDVNGTKICHKHSNAYKFQ